MYIKQLYLKEVGTSWCTLEPFYLFRGQPEQPSLKHPVGGEQHFGKSRVYDKKMASVKPQVHLPGVLQAEASPDNPLSR